MSTLHALYFWGDDNKIKLKYKFMRIHFAIMPQKNQEIL